MPLVYQYVRRYNTKHMKGLIKTKEDIELLREGGMKLAQVMDHVLALVRSGVATQELDAIAEKRIRDFGGASSFKGYKGSARAPYPASICVSVNDAIVHGIPSQETLREGDVVSIDIGLYYKKRFTDMARTVVIGEGDEATKKFIVAAKEALAIGVSYVRAGARLGDVGNAIEEFVKEKGYGVVRELVGHGVGYAVHEDPQIPNWGQKGRGMSLQEGMVIAIEPMITEGSEDIMLDRGGWVYRTMDGSRAAHFEDTILVMKNGYEVLTQ